MGWLGTFLNSTNIQSPAPGQEGLMAIIKCGLGFFCMRKTWRNCSKFSEGLSELLEHLSFEKRLRQLGQAMEQISQRGCGIFVLGSVQERSAQRLLQILSEFSVVLD